MPEVAAGWGTAADHAETAEVNFDGLVGPTHHYAGLSIGNVASLAHRGQVANPREAARQGLAKMRALADLGLPQAVLPPQERPDVAALRRLGFGGSDAAVLAGAARHAPELLSACASASSMWVANAATVSPAPDTADGRLHLTPANLVSKLHRALEAGQTTRTLRAIFHEQDHFAVHEPLPAAANLGDEGAANHTRLAPGHGSRGLHLFAYGHRALGPAETLTGPRRFPSRQALEASAAVARQHGLSEESLLFLRQNPVAIDAGVFHNDVIAVGNENLLLHHEQAFADGPAVAEEIRRRYAALHPGRDLAVVTVPSRRVSLRTAVRSYLFNSQLVTLAPGHMALVAPLECRENPRVAEFLHRLVASGATPLREVLHFDLRQSMHNGGGPACLRLRVALTRLQRRALPHGVWLTPAAHALLLGWVERHYRERLTAADLADPSLLDESRRALDELTGLLGLGSIYPFQRA